ncbi:MAG: hypothetical protein ABMB14_01040, partial [Myxococcota bacterium]
MWWFAAAFAAAFAVAFAADPVSTDPGAPCTFAVDGTVVDRLDCAAGGAWVVVCPIPEGPSGKIRIRATLPIDAGAPLTGAARVPLADRRALEVPISGPGGRGGGFVVGKA